MGEGVCIQFPLELEKRTLRILLECFLVIFIFIAVVFILGTSGCQILKAVLDHPPKC